MTFTYMQIHLYFIIPPIFLLWSIYRPLIGRREVIKLLWLGFMATIWTTPWDNYILSQDGWSYPPGSIIGKLGYVPIEEHIFFILQPILIILLHLIITHGRLLPFDTLSRRPLASLFWIGISLLGLRLVLQTHLYAPLDYGLKQKMFYLGWILVWINPVIAFLTYLGARLTKADWATVILGTSWLWVVDTIALRSGSWSISPSTTLGVKVWRGLPIEEAIFFFLTTYLIVLSSSLISHIHTLLVLSPNLPPCPPSNPLAHIGLLAKVAFNSPTIDRRILEGLREAEKTLKKGSKSFEIAKLAFGREMRLGLVVIYAWCRVTDNLIDDPFPTISEQDSSSLDQARSKILEAIRKHLITTYRLADIYPAQNHPEPSSNSGSELDEILDEIPNLTPSDRTAFHLFSLIIPRLIPIYPFLELCDGYSTDLQFPSKPLTTIAEAGSLDISDKLPIRTTEDLLHYADDVAGSIASSICYLAWSVLDSDLDRYPSSNTTVPVKNYTFADDLHDKTKSQSSARSMRGIRSEGGVAKTGEARQRKQLRVIQSAREMGRSLQLVNISRDIIKDALISRLYIPISYFDSPQSIISILFPSSPDSGSASSTTTKPHTESDHSGYIDRLLSLADSMRDNSLSAIEDLPNISKSGIRTMIISYYEIAHAIRSSEGAITERGIKVGKWTRMRKAVKAFWLG
uniref:Bifunctional lycopene cyclase/phytoene synthase n=1 Tax=Kwoniella dejecticola CBS 10117 TaxID=1296121 RepID=A0A1A6A6W3_9TREE|nr:uncharacterized protein I303_03513 [Kwoniella dejecticola CBS 10117]OBR85800.1 hypothetical protein I303_03513 [Kwoniella dejecticola CBS 10117]